MDVGSSQDSQQSNRSVQSWDTARFSLAPCFSLCDALLLGVTRFVLSASVKVSHTVIIASCDKEGSISWRWWMVNFKILNENSDEDQSHAMHAKSMMLF